jgi:hypothetical protein
MIYTRRKLLRNAANVSVAAYACSAFPVLSYGATQPNTFDPGVRIFFIGTWVFCPNSTGDHILAVTVDDNMGHTFPFGPWKPNTFDKNSDLVENHGSASQGRPYEVKVSGYQTKLTSVSQVFTDAASNCEFVFAKIPLSNFPPTFKKPGIRVISIPLPSKLYTGIFSGGQISSSNFPVSMKAAASAHVFEYVGGTLTYTDSSMNVSLKPVTDYNGDFHFHTVPPKCTRHGEQMFTDLLDAIFPEAKALAVLKAACDDSNPDPGKYLPISVTKSLDEMDMVLIQCPPQPPTPGCIKSSNKRKPFHRTTASCAGAGIGVLGG